MAIRIDDKPTASIEQARQILENYSSSVGIYIDLDRVIDYDLYSQKNIITMTPMLREYLGDDTLGATKVGAIKNRVLEVYDVDPNMLLNKQRVYSLEKEVRERVIEDAHEFDEDFVEFIKFYHELTEMTTIQRQVKHYLTAPPATVRNHEGNRMVVVNPKWSIATTGRIQSSKPNFQGMSRYMKDIITYPPGFQLVQADSGQIEPRIMYSEYIKDNLLKRLIEVYDDAYFGQLHYVMMTPEEEREARNNLQGVQKKEWDKELREDLKKLSLAGGYGSTNLERFNRELAPRFMNKIVNHPLRKEWEEKVKHNVYNEGAEQFYSAFGTVVKPEEKDGKYTELREWKGHLVRCGINNPLQTTAADLMSQSVYEADKILRTECKQQGAIAAYIHDAGYYYLHEDDVDKVAPMLIDSVAYEVRDWIPIRSEGEVGRIPLSHVPIY